jgi:hypothetical protein
MLGGGFSPRAPVAQHLPSLFPLFARGPNPRYRIPHRLGQSALEVALAYRVAVSVVFPADAPASRFVTAQAPEYG